MSDMDPQAGAEQLDEDVLPEDTIPDEFIEPEDWDRGAGAAEGQEFGHEEYSGGEDALAQDLQAPLPAEEAAMHIEPGIAVEE
jgi:hypothetical protein